MRKSFLALAAAAIALTGCDFDSHDASQPDVIGPVVQVEASASGCPPEAPAECDIFGGDAPGGAQVLAAYLVPADAGIPDTVDVTGDVDTTLARNVGYEQALDQLQPPQAGTRWAGYVSGILDRLPNEWSATGDFRAPVVDGLARGPFRYRVVSGSRAGDDPDVPVRCVEAGQAEPLPTDARCIGAILPPASEPLAELPVRDLAVLPGDAQQVEPGATAQVPFTLRYAGPASPAADFSIEATTTLPGVQPLPASPTVAPPADSDTPLAVSVAVPAGTAPGDYDVTLTASLPNGQERTATGRVSVPAPPSSSPPPSAPATPPASAPSELTLTEPPHAEIVRMVEPRLRGRMLFTGFVVRCPPGLPVNCGGSGRAFGGKAAARTAQRRRSSVIGKAGLAVPSGGERELRVRLTPRGVRFLRNRRSVKLELSATIRGRSGARVTTQREVTLALPQRCSPAPPGFVRAARSSVHRVLISCFPAGCFLPAAGRRAIRA